jgi:hypothetical protein
MCAPTWATLLHPKTEHIALSEPVPILQCLSQLPHLHFNTDVPLIFLTMKLLFLLGLAKNVFAMIFHL